MGLFRYKSLCMRPALVYSVYNTYTVQQNASRNFKNVLGVSLSGHVVTKLCAQLPASY